MEELLLEFNDYVTYIFVLTLKDGAYEYYFSDKTLWFMDDWQYIHKEKDNGYVENALAEVDEDVVPIEEITKEIKRLNKIGDKATVLNHLPMLFVNFEDKILKSRYFEQNLHDKVMEGWTGIYEDFLDEIPKAYKYW